MGKFFITGGSGFIGSIIIEELISNGHQVSALSRSSASEDKLKSISESIEIVHGTVTDLEVIKKAVADSDGLFHLAYNNDLTKREEAAAVDTKFIDAIVPILKGTDKPFVYTGVTAAYFQTVEDGAELTEDTKIDLSKLNFGVQRAENEQLVLSLADQGIKTSVIRLPPSVYGENDPNFVTAYVKGSLKAGYVGLPDQVENNVWPTVNKRDAAKLYIAAAFKGRAGSIYHAVATNVKVSDIAKAISEKYSLPLKKAPLSELSEDYGVLGNVLFFNAPASSLITQSELGWKPTGPSLVETIPKYY